MNRLLLLILVFIVLSCSGNENKKWVSIGEKYFSEEHYTQEQFLFAESGGGKISFTPIGTNKKIAHVLSDAIHHDYSIKEDVFLDFEGDSMIVTFYQNGEKDIEVKYLDVASFKKKPILDEADLCGVWFCDLEDGSFEYDLQCEPSNSSLLKEGYSGIAKRLAYQASVRGGCLSHSGIDGVWDLGLIDEVSLLLIKPDMGETYYTRLFVINAVMSDEIHFLGWDKRLKPQQYIFRKTDTKYRTNDFLGEWEIKSIKACFTDKKSDEIVDLGGLDMSIEEVVTPLPCLLTAVDLKEKEHSVTFLPNFGYLIKSAEGIKRQGNWRVLLNGNLIGFDIKSDAGLCKEELLPWKIISMGNGYLEIQAVLEGESYQIKMEKKA